MDQYYREILKKIGEDPEREGLLRTPLRAAEAMRFMTRGYGESIEQVLNNAIFHEEYDDMVILKDIEFYSLCEHHLLPFFGRCHVAYLPAGKIIGLSKIARLVDVFSRRLQVQERMTAEIAGALEEAIEPRGVAVVCEAQHMCMLIRGVQKQNSSMVTSHVSGAFREDPRTRTEFMELLRVTREGGI